jgi:para-nitrobenzyl esterase
MFRLRLLLPLSVLLTSLGAGVATAEENGPLVVTNQGILQGTETGPNGTRIFLGIPYAEAPVGPLRFRPAQPATPWPGIRPALAFGPACVQPRNGFSADGPQSEDCLSLNVYAANPFIDAPVMVFIHGGGFVTGAGAQFDGQSLAETGGVIVVTINYRLGALAFLSLPELDAEGTPSGNYALRDQQLALAWVRDNIAAFGGDPDNVTVFGESAGAVSTCVQMVSPLSRTLAKQFIMQSGTCDSVGTTSTVAQARATTARVVNAVCSGRSDVVACLRAAPASSLVAVPVQTNIFDLGFLPVVNPADPLLPQSPRAMIAAGNYNKGASIIGSNARELGLFQLSGAAPVVRNIAELNAVIDARFGPLSPLVKQQYTAASDAEANNTLTRLGTDLIFRCPARAFARRTSGQGSQVFLYHFEEGLAFHAFELPYVFRMPNPILGAATLVEFVSPQFQTAFTSFAALGEPRPSLDAGDGPVTDVVFGELPPWPRYTAAGDRHISVKRISEEGTGLSRSDCDFLESIGAVQ